MIHSDRPSQPIALTPHDDCRYVAVSRDGKWGATASHFGSKVKVWNAETGDLVQTLPVESSSWVRFSPDGRWLATPVGARHLWKVGTWEAGPDLGGLVAGFSEDGRLVAVDDLSGSVHLLDPDTAREYVRLEHPLGYGADRYFFTPDGTELVAVGTARPSGFAWSLQRIREQLAARGLDWDLPPFRPASTARQTFRSKSNCGRINRNPKRKKKWCGSVLRGAELHSMQIPTTPLPAMNSLGFSCFHRAHFGTQSKPFALRRMRCRWTQTTRTTAIHWEWLTIAKGGTVRLPIVFRKT